MEAEGLEGLANLPSRNKSLIEIGLPAIKSRISSTYSLVSTIELVSCSPDSTLD